MYTLITREIDSPQRLSRITKTAANERRTPPTDERDYRPIDDRTDLIAFSGLTPPFKVRTRIPHLQRVVAPRTTRQIKG